MSFLYSAPEEADKSARRQVTPEENAAAAATVTYADAVRHIKEEPDDRREYSLAPGLTMQ